MTKSIFHLVIYSLLFLIRSGYCQYDVEYERLFIGKFNPYAHQIKGSVYAIDEYTILIRKFYYDGEGNDAYFWAGSTNKPSNVGFIVPDEEGRTNRLPQYTFKDFTLTLPNNKKITEIRWLSIYDLSTNINYADIFFPEGFNVPAPQKLSEFSSRRGGLSTGTVVIVDSRTIEIPEFRLKPAGANLYFWVGNGSFPRAAGKKIPDENGYLSPLQEYNGKDITLQLPGNLNVFKINWLSVWNVDEGVNYGSISIPDGLHIPPSLVEVIEVDRLPNCYQLHRKLQLQWHIAGPAVTYTLASNVREDDYVAFGLSGSDEKSQMLNADVAVSFLTGQQSQTIDYNITAHAPCTNILGRYKGVCPDVKVQGHTNYQAFNPSIVNGITKFIFRRTMSNVGDHGDKTIEPDKEQYYIWAIGKINALKQPGYHYLYPKGDLKLKLGDPNFQSDCFDFTTERPVRKTAWGPFRISDKYLDTFSVRVGPAGGSKGYFAQTGFASSGQAFYINGLLAPEIFVQRGKTYKFVVEAGNNPHDVRFYHPFYITENPYGAFSSLSPEEALKEKLNIITGVKFSRRGRPQPTTAGRLCRWILDKISPREADKFPTFARYRAQMTLHCDKGKAAILQWTPNVTTPDTLYYQSYSHSNMGWKINVVDEIIHSAASAIAPISLILTISFLCLFQIF